MIEATAICKSFRRGGSPADRLKEIFSPRTCHDIIPTLQDVSFDVKRGETLGIIGRNGAGKSTLLKILNGVLLPDSGTVVTDGKVTGLLELGTGFDFNLSGLQNIKTNGLLLGMRSGEIDAAKDSIIRFAELGPYISEPLRTYSSGMIMRLAFAIAIHARPGTFLIDEALSVGDAHFQQKCMHHIREFRKAGGSIVFVSHDLNAVKLICDKVLVLECGQIVKAGTPEAAVNHYFQLIAGESDDIEVDSSPEASGYGSMQVRFKQAEISGVDSGNSEIVSGEELELLLTIEAVGATGDLTVGMGIRDRLGQNMFGTNSHQLGIPLSVGRGETCRYKFKFPCFLAPGEYSISLSLHEGADHTEKCYHWWDRACKFRVTGYKHAAFGGVCDLTPRLEIIKS